jgi:hypothetical protein
MTPTPARVLLGAAAAGLLAAWLAPTTARASCGDYLLDEHRGDLSATADSPHPGAPAPCHGALCSDKPSVPAAPSPAPIPSVEQWCLTVTAAAQPPWGPRWFAGGEAPPRSIFSHDPIERPPR